MSKNISFSNWENFIIVCFQPGLGGEMFAKFLYNKIYPSYTIDLTDINAKFDFIVEESPLKWRLNQPNALGWFMKTMTSVEGPGNHHQLSQKLNLGDNFFRAFFDTEDTSKFDQLAYKILKYNKIDHFDINDQNRLLEYISTPIEQFPSQLEFDNYQLTIIHPYFRWFNKNPKFNHFPNGKAIQLTCSNDKAIYFYFLSFIKMYDMYTQYANIGDNFRKDFLSNLESNFYKKCNEYQNGFCLPYEREPSDNLNIDVYDFIFNKNYNKYLLELSIFLNLNLSTVDTTLLNIYYDKNIQLLNKYQIDMNKSTTPEELFKNFNSFHKSTN